MYYTVFHRLTIEIVSNITSDFEDISSEESEDDDEAMKRNGAVVPVAQPAQVSLCSDLCSDLCLTNEVYLSSYF